MSKDGGDMWTVGGAKDGLREGNKIIGSDKGRALSADGDPTL